MKSWYCFKRAVSVKQRRVHFKKSRYNFFALSLRNWTITMSITVVKYLNRFGTRTLRPPFYTLVRTGTNEPCPPKPQEPCPAKAEPCPPPAPTCPEPPPCPTMPQCPPTICPPVVDPNNPCNYCPPPCIDTDYPDLTKLKKLQCLFQQDDGLPVFLKKGNTDAFLYQLTIVLTLISLGMSMVSSYKLATK